VEKGGDSSLTLRMTFFNLLPFLTCHPEALAEGSPVEILPLRFAQGRMTNKKGSEWLKKEGSDAVLSRSEGMTEKCSDAVLSRSPELRRRVCERFTKSHEKRFLMGNFKL
jgi:hypothetical protein